jgi:copper chaperone CopZ
MKVKLKLKINGMHCSSCAMNIDGELEDLGVKDVRTNYAKGETEVEFDDEKVQIGQIQKAISTLGYTSEHLNAEK